MTGKVIFKTSVSADQVRALLNYDPETGVFTWRPRENPSQSNWNERWSGKRAGTKSSFGYRDICLNSAVYKEHRLAFLWMTGRWPEADIDHVDMNRDNNAWLNLREASRSQNHGNRKVRRDSATGVKGVYYDKKLNKYVAYIKLTGGKKHLGCFVNQSDAAAEYAKNARSLFGDFARTA
jgi:hypothetical protein